MSIRPVHIVSSLAAPLAFAALSLGAPDAHADPPPRAPQWRRRASPTSCPGPAASRRQRRSLPPTRARESPRS